MQLVRFQCPSCSASLPPKAPCGTISCDYCGAVFASEQTQQAHDQAGHVLSTEQLAQAIVKAQHEMQQQQLRQQQQQLSQHQLQQQHMARVHGVQISSQTATRAAKGVAWLAIVPVILVLAISGVVTAVVVRQVDQATDAVENAFGGGSSAGGSDANQPDISWDPRGTPPIITQVAGQDAIIGRMRTVGGSDLLFFDAYGIDGERLWRIGDLGTYADAYQAVQIGPVGEFIAISDAKSRIRVFGRDDGKQRHEVALSDNVERICSPMFALPGVEVENPDKIWFEQIDERKFLLDPETGALEESEDKPTWCINDRDLTLMRGPGKNPLDAAPTVEGLKLKRVHVDGDLAAAMGIKTPGTEVPRAIGFDPSTKAVTWDVVVSQVQKGSVRSNSTDHSGLAGGRFAATYGEGQDKWHIAAFDAKDGTLLWDETLRGIFAVDWLQGFAMTEDYVLVVRMSSVEVRDAKTGKLRLVIGHETYDDSF